MIKQLVTSSESFYNSKSILIEEVKGIYWKLTILKSINIFNDSKDSGHWHFKLLN